VARNMQLTSTNSTPQVADNAMQPITVALRSTKACEGEIAPEGSVRHGRLIASSSLLLAWLETLQRSRWHQTHRESWSGESQGELTRARVRWPQQGW
jgi:hypothetical protein